MPEPIPAQSWEDILRHYRGRSPKEGQAAARAAARVTANSHALDATDEAADYAAAMNAHGAKLRGETVAATATAIALQYTTDSEQGGDFFERAARAGEKMRNKYRKG